VAYTEAMADQEGRTAAPSGAGRGLIRGARGVVERVLTDNHFCDHGVVQPGLAEHPIVHKYCRPKTKAKVSNATTAPSSRSWPKCAHTPATPTAAGGLTGLPHRYNQHRGHTVPGSMPPGSLVTNIPREHMGDARPDLSTPVRPH
jgi:hypothetical protein